MQPPMHTCLCLLIWGYGRRNYERGICGLIPTPAFSPIRNSKIGWMEVRVDVYGNILPDIDPPINLGRRIHLQIIVAGGLVHCGCVDIRATPYSPTGT